MKSIYLLTFLFSLLFSAGFAQTYEKPHVETVGDRICFITKVEYAKQYTIVSFEHLNNKGWINLNPTIHIKTPDNKRYNYIKSDGISIAPENYSFKEGEKKHSFTVYFEPLPKSVKIFDILEVEPGNRFVFNFYGVNVAKKRTSDEQITHFPEDYTTTVEAMLTPGPPANFMNQFGDMYKDIFKSSIEASLNYFKQPNVMTDMAKMSKAYYDALIAEGFTKEQALQILISTSFMPKVVGGN